MTADGWTCGNPLPHNPHQSGLEDPCPGLELLELEAIRDTALTVEQEIRLRLAIAAIGRLKGNDDAPAQAAWVVNIANAVHSLMEATTSDGVEPIDGPDDACRDNCPEGVDLRKQLSVAEYEIGKTRAERDSAARTALELREDLHTARVQRDNAREELQATRDERDGIFLDLAAASDRVNTLTRELDLLERQRDEVLTYVGGLVPQHVSTSAMRRVREIYASAPLAAPRSTEDDETGVAGVTGGAKRQRGSEAVA